MYQFEADCSEGDAYHATNNAVFNSGGGRRVDLCAIVINGMSTGSITACRKSVLGVLMVIVQEENGARAFACVGSSALGALPSVTAAG